MTFSYYAYHADAKLSATYTYEPGLDGFPGVYLAQASIRLDQRPFQCEARSIGKDRAIAMAIMGLATEILKSLSEVP